MALVYPEKPELNDAELLVYHYVKDNLPSSFVGYFNYRALYKEFDTSILLPNLGILIVEIKGWLADRIKHVRDNNCIVYKSGGEDVIFNSPLRQAQGYRWEFLGRIRRELNRNVRVLPAVCYPYITKEEFYEKRLDIVSPEGWTILKDDLSTSDGMLSKIVDMFDRFEPSNCDAFDIQTMIEVRRFFETEEQIQGNLENINGTPRVSRSRRRECYSLLQYIPAGTTEKAVKDIAGALVEEWGRGTKIIVLSDSKDVIETVKSLEQKKIEEMNLAHKFKFQDEEGRERNYTFNFELHLVKENLGSAFLIMDGDIEEVKKYRNLLEKADETSTFNLAQYEVEHAPTERDMVIKAGAGTGKTTSMVSRLGFLIYAHDLNARELVEKIILITFTNEAADTMKERFKKYLQNYYLVTRDIRFFAMLESLEEMRILTIHSFARRIIEDYSAFLGLGKDFSITASARYERKQLLYQEINRYLEEESQRNPRVWDEVRLTMYHLQSYLTRFQEKLENKNVDILQDNLNFGSCDQLPALHQLIKEVLRKSEYRLRDQLDQENRMRISDLILKLRKLLDEHKIEQRNYEIKYVFVDEFQDTDNVQIDLLKAMQQVFGFNFFVVGDVKQCIYRFRGAEEKAFDHLDISGWLEYSLNKNYRTDASLLDRFEQSFTRWGTGVHPRLVYDEAKDRLRSIKRLNKPGEEFFRRVDVEDENDFEAKFVETLNEEYQRLPKGECLAILVRENKQVEDIRRLGEENGFFIETQSGGDLFSIDPTTELYKLVLALQNPTNPKFLFNLFHTCYVQSTLETSILYEYRRDRQALCSLFADSQVIPNWTAYLQDLKLKPVLKVLREIVNDVCPWDIYAQGADSEEDHDKRRKFYKRNLDQVFEKLALMADADYLTINQIEKYLQIMILTQQKEETRESLKVDSDGGEKKIVCTTVHKAKGLEFHTVFLPYTNHRMDDTRKSGPVDVVVTRDHRVGYKIRLDDPIWSTRGYPIWYIKNNHYLQEEEREINFKIDEETRILYVAMTRAIRYFTYFHYTNLNGKEAKYTWQTMVEEGSQ
ncbi:MAG: ATP-dependent helicase [Thermosipho sp. (in: Bacteria)]|nr:ATP-dependent helicase [Thermosipho sp. (in: thermotogales)]